MYIQYIKQAWNLLRQEKLFSSIYIVGTGLSITMVMALSIIFYIRIADVYPETNRSRTLLAKSVNEVGGAMGNSSAPLSWQLIESCFRPLERSGATISVTVRNFNEDFFVQPEGSALQWPVTVKFVDDAFWKLFPFRFLDGQAFGRAEWESGVQTAVIASSLSRRLFGDDHAVGRYVSLNFHPYRVCGVAEDASFLTPRSYAQLWIPFTASSDDYRKDVWGDTGSLGRLEAYILAPSAGDVNRLREEAAENVRRYTSQYDPVKISMMGQPDVYWKSTFRYYSNEEPDFTRLLLTYGLIFFLLLAVPAVSLSGMTGSRIERRLAEMGIRRAFGATRGILMRQIVGENLVFTLLGGGLGLLLSYLLVVVGRNWIMEIGASTITVPPEGSSIFLSPSMLLNGTVFGIALAVCFLLNLFSAFVPAWKASRTAIVHSLNT
ncbi:MAG: ABC transporter permease [Tannerellaceae bacterium]|jgi:putative ABC transport system permease protein|nr:ABC transporter permease [Tannerellaceae bacterium]